MLLKPNLTFSKSTSLPALCNSVVSRGILGLGNGMMGEMRFVRFDRDDKGDHGPGCNCLDCWLAHGKKFVDERGLPFKSGGEEHDPACSCPECREMREMDNEVIVDRRRKPVNFKKRVEKRRAVLRRALGMFRRRSRKSQS